MFQRFWLFPGHPWARLGPRRALEEKGEIKWGMSLETKRCLGRRREDRPGVGLKEEEAWPLICDSVADVEQDSLRQGDGLL